VQMSCIYIFYNTISNLICEVVPLRLPSGLKESLVN
jgi:hypothetical protein